LTIDKLFLLGVSHKTASVEQREALSVPEAETEGLLRAVRAGGVVSEAVALSTCNRLEVYAAAESFDKGGACLRRILQDRAKSALPEEAFYLLRGSAAARHLFRVAAGLESMVVGETEILGQVKRAYELARAAGSTGKQTNLAFQRALHAGKTVRSRTAVSEGPTSVAGAAVALSQKIFGDLKDNRVLVVGAGKTAELSARHLAAQNPGALTVVNRTEAKARELAERFGGRAAPFENLRDELARADVVLCSTGSPLPVISLAEIEHAVKNRRGRPLFLIDMAVPRDVDPAAHTFQDVYLYNIDDLEGVVRDSVARRKQEILKAESLVDEAAREFSERFAAVPRDGAGSLQSAPPDPLATTNA
jgi:glutamyl-tRNA reductase